MIVNEYRCVRNPPVHPPTGLPTNPAVHIVLRRDSALYCNLGGRNTTTVGMSSDIVAAGSSQGDHRTAGIRPRLDDGRDSLGNTDAARIHLGVDRATYFQRFDTAGIGTSIDRPVDAADVDTAGIGGRPHFPIDLAGVDASGVGPAINRTFDAAHIDTAGIGARPQAAVVWDLNLQAHSDAAKDGSIAYRHPDGIAGLLDRRVRFQLAHPALNVAAAQPVIFRLKNPTNADRTGSAGNDEYASRIGDQVEIDEPSHAERPLERTVPALGLADAQRNCEEYQCSHIDI